MYSSEIEDSFLVEALEEFERNEAHQLQLSTPPDTEICESFRGDDDPHTKSICSEKVCENTDPPISNVHNDFRSKLMNSLLKTQKQLSDSSRNVEACTSNLVTNIRPRPGDEDEDDLDIFLSADWKSLHDPIKRKVDEESNVFNLSNNFSSPKVPKIIPKEATKLFNKSNSNLNNLLFNSNIEAKQLISRSSTLETLSPNVPNRCNSAIKRRKFPGPAGLLPKWDSRTHFKSVSLEDRNEDFNDAYVQGQVCSQSTAHDFISGCWKNMLSDLARFGNVSSIVLENNNIRWILRRAAFRGQGSIRKIPFIAVMIRSIDPSHLDATAVFQDETGVIHGAVSKDVIEKYTEFISVGTVLLLKEVTMLSPVSIQGGVNIIKQVKKHYLNITLNSVISIYSQDDSRTIIKTEVIKITHDFMKKLLLEEGHKNKLEIIEKEEETAIEDEPLFESILSNKNGRPTPRIPSQTDNFRPGFPMQPRNHRFRGSPRSNNSSPRTPLGSSYPGSLVRPQPSTSHSYSTYKNPCLSTPKPYNSDNKSFVTPPGRGYQFVHPASTPLLAPHPPGNKQAIRPQNRLNYNICNSSSSNKNNGYVSSKININNNVKTHVFTNNNKLTKPLHDFDDEDDELDSILATINTDLL